MPPEPEKEAPAAKPRLVIEFEDATSWQFTFSQEGVSPYQLLLARDFLTLVGEEQVRGLVLQLQQLQQQRSPLVVPKLKPGS